MKNGNFELDDDENVDEKLDKININNQNNKSNLKPNKQPEKTDLMMKKKKKGIKKDNITESLKNENIPFEEQEVIEFVLMDFRQPDELNKFVNMKSLSLVQQNIKSINVNSYIYFYYFNSF